MEERNRPTRHVGRRRSRKRRQRELMIRAITFAVIIVGVIGGAFLIKKYGPTKERADLNEYYGIENENQLAVIVDREVIRQDVENQDPIVAKGVMLDGHAYIEYSVVRDCINDRFYVDYNENILLYTLPEGTIKAEVGSSEYTLQKQKQSVGYPILKMEGDIAYIAIDFVRQYTNIDFRLYGRSGDEPGRVVVEAKEGTLTVAKTKKKTQVRFQGGHKSKILSDVSKGEQVVILEDEGDWKKVCTKDGYVGYIKSSHLKKRQEKNLSSDFQEPIYQNISRDYTINLAWHLVTNRTANNDVLSTIADTKGLTTISPTWFTVADTDGNIKSLASAQYVNYAHQSNIEVWASVSDFRHAEGDNSINSFEESYELLSHTSSRENLINQLIAEAIQANIDGINVDFEKISVQCGEHYIQFIRELAYRCRQNGIILSVDNYVPQPYNAHYNLKEQGIVADYVIIMGYDEHTSDSYESGSVASYDFVKKGIEDTLEVVPKEKVINAVPFYTRLWKEVPKTAEELAQQEGTEAANYAVKVTSEVCRMNRVSQVVAGAGAEIVYDEVTHQNYAEWEADGAVFKIWLEDETSLEERLKLMKEHELAGTAAWRLGFEDLGTWDLILKYVN